jgi:hypothetical protein
VSCNYLLKKSDVTTLLEQEKSDGTRYDLTLIVTGKTRGMIIQLPGTEPENFMGGGQQKKKINSLEFFY